MFKNLMVYRMVSPWAMTQAKLEEALQSARFVECGASQDKSVGWVEPRGEAHGPLVEIVGGQWLLKLMMEVKTVPGSVVKRKVQDQLDHIEATTGRKPGKKEKREISEDVRLSLLPMAFTKQASVLVWIDAGAQRVVLDCASQARSGASRSEFQRPLPSPDSESRVGGRRVGGSRSAFRVYSG